MNPLTFSEKVDYITMIRKGKKVISLLAVILLVVLTISPAAMAVTYPEGVTREQITATIGKTDRIIEGIVKTTPQGSLEKLILPELYKNQVLSSLLVGLYGAIEENAESISALGLDVTVKGVASHLTEYPKIQEKLSSYSKWSEVDLSKAKWGVKDKDGFINAVASMLSPFNDVLYMLLCGGSYSINPIVGLKGAKGYETAIIPTLKALGCETITDSSVFYAQANENRKTMLKNIIGDIFILVERILANPCDVLTDILPSIAYFLEEGGLDKAVATLIEPLKLQLFNISTFIKVETILAFIQNSESFTQDFTLNFNDIVGGNGLKMAEINLKELASCGTVSGGTVISDKAATFTVLMRWLIDTAKLNKDSLGDISGDAPVDISGITDKLFAKSTDEIIVLFVKLLNADGGKTNDYSWTFGNFESANVTYTQNLTRDNFQKVVNGIDDLINQFIAEGGQYKTVREALVGEVYSNNLISTLVCEIYGMLSGEDLKAVADIAGLVVTPAAVANELTESRFLNTRYVLSKASSWDKVNPKTLTWGFKNGDREGFVKALCAALRPMEDILNMLLCEGKIQVMGAVDVYGSNGYNTAIIPMLEALGCSNDSILTYEEYKKAAGKGKGTEAIVNSLLSLVERALDRPVYTITEILPNLLYFINNKGIETCVENIIYPLTNMLKEFGMEDMLTMPELSEMDVEKMAADMLKGNDMGIELSSFDINQFASMGELVTVKSKRTIGGEAVNISYVKADQPAIMITLVRFIADFMKTPGNEGMMMGFMGSGEDNMFADFSGGIGAEIAAMSTDETVEWLYKIFFRERPVVEVKPQEDYLPTIIYNPPKTIEDAAPVLTGFLILAAVEVLIVCNRKRINYYIEEMKVRRANKKATDSQEV